VAGPQNVRFKSDGLICAGWLFAPVDLQPSGASGIVLVHGLGGVKEMDLEPFATAFADAGHVVLAFDHRFLGESQGDPRGQIFPHQQQEDLRNAITWLGERPEVDRERIGVWGTSFGGGHVIQVAAHDKRIKAAVAQAPPIDAWTNFQRIAPPELMDALLQVVAEDRRYRYATGERRSLPMFAPEGQPSALGHEEYERHVEWQKRAPHWHNGITIESLERILEFLPGAYIERVAPTPLLMIVASDDVVTPTDLALEAYERARSPKSLHKFDGEHYAIYDDPQIRGTAINVAREWFDEHLAA
jgi:fermentation-respiration switch protein FrsA (DUF1100 family)